MKFEQYELQNKNYQIAFNRQIEHMDFEYSIQKKEALFGAIAGTISGAAKGGFTGGITGGPYGAAAGAVVGGALSGIGGVLDYSNLTARQRENRQFAIDNFRYQLGNIQALPYNLNKVNPFTLNNKIFPFIEIYSCTDEERMTSDSLLINAYDNSILYTDWVLSSIIDVIDQPDVVSSFVFVSDHGEHISKDGAGHGGNCSPLKEEYHVPFIFWWSEAYEVLHPEKTHYAQLQLGQKSVQRYIIRMKNHNIFAVNFLTLSDWSISPIAFDSQFSIIFCIIAFGDCSFLEHASSAVLADDWRGALLGRVERSTLLQHYLIQCPWECCSFGKFFLIL